MARFKVTGPMCTEQSSTKNSILRLTPNEPAEAAEACNGTRLKQTRRPLALHSEQYLNASGNPQGEHSFVAWWVRAAEEVTQETGSGWALRTTCLRNVLFSPFGLTLRVDTSLLFLSFVFVDKISTSWLYDLYGLLRGWSVNPKCQPKRRKRLLL